MYRPQFIRLDFTFPSERFLAALVVQTFHGLDEPPQGIIIIDGFRLLVAGRRNAIWDAEREFPVSWLDVNLLLRS
jgi:hypothetical protein